MVINILVGKGLWNIVSDYETKPVVEPMSLATPTPIGGRGVLVVAIALVAPPAPKDE